jgi:hypothetical protein
VPPAKLYVKPLTSFPEKKQKRWLCFAEDQISAKPTQGVWGRAPRKLYAKYSFLLFQERSKSVSSDSQTEVGFDLVSVLRDTPSFSGERGIQKGM